MGFTETDINDLSEEIGEKLSETEFKDRMDDVHEKVSFKKVEICWVMAVRP